MNIQKVCIVIGLIMMLSSVLGAMIPGGEIFPHSIFSIGSYFTLGLILLASGLNSRKIRTRNASLGIGIFFILLGLGGFLFGEKGIPSNGSFRVDEKLFVLIPGIFEFETLNHLVHLILGGFLLSAYYLEKKKEDAFSKITVYLQTRRAR